MTSSEKMVGLGTRAATLPGVRSWDECRVGKCGFVGLWSRVGSGWEVRGRVGSGLGAWEQSGELIKGWGKGRE